MIPLASPGPTPRDAQPCARFDDDALLGRTLVREGVLNEEQLKTAISAQQTMRAQGITLRLGEVLVQQGVLTPQQVRQFLHLVGKQLLHCPRCGKNYNVKNWRPGVEVFCPTCSALLVPPASERTIDAHATTYVAPDAADARDAAGRPFGRYRLLQELGRGGMGIVWKAWDTQLKRIVALKQILDVGQAVSSPAVAPDAITGILPACGTTSVLSADPAQIERFMREARLAANLKHPNIISVYDVGVHEGQHYLTTDYIAGKSLDKVAKEKQVSTKQALEWVKQVADALAYAHEQGVVHRDVKPANILIDGKGQPHVMDFGLAKDVTGEAARGFSLRDGKKKKHTLTVSGALLGTPQYMSPEQASGQAAELGAPSDQFSLGIVLYELLTRFVPFDGNTLRDLLNAISEKDPVRPTQLNRRIHRDVETICLKTLEKNPVKRYSTMGEFAADIGRYLSGEPIHARPVGTVARLWRKAVKHRAVVAPSSATALLAVFFLGWLVVSAHLKSEKIRKALEEAARVEQEGDFQKARDGYAGALKLDEGNEAAKSGFARTKAKLDELAEAERKKLAGTESKAKAQDEAMRLLEEGRPALDDVVKYLYNKNANYEELRRRVELGQKKIEEAIRLAPHVPLGHYLMGRAWDLLGWDNKAEECWKEAMRLALDWTPPHYMLGRLYMARAFIATTGFSREEIAAKRGEAEKLAAKAMAHLDAAKGGGAFDKPMQRELAAGMLAYVKMDYETAIALARAGIEKYADIDGVEEFYYLLGIGISSPDEKITTLARAIEKCPNYALARFARGIAHDSKGEHDAALEDLTEAIRVNPVSAVFYVARGGAHAANHEYDMAIDDYSEAIRINPQFAEAHSNRGGMRDLKGDLDGAVADYSEAIRINPAYAGAYTNRGSARRKKGDLDEAIADHSEAIRIDPRSANAYYSRSLAREAKGDYEGKIADLTEAIRIDSRHADAYFARGNAYREKGKLDGAIADYGEAIRIDPRSAKAYNNRGAARGMKGDLDGAIADLTEAIGIDPRHADAYNNRAAARNYKGDHDGAIADCSEAILINPRDADAYSNRATARIAKGDYGAAITDCDEAIRIDPRLATAYANRGYAHDAKRDHANAIADWEKALELASPNWPYRKDVEQSLAEAKKKRK